MCGAWRDGAAAHGVVFDDEPSGSRGAFGAVGRGAFGAAGRRAFGGHPIVARLCRDAIQSARRRQNAREMRSPSVRQRQDIAPMRSWAAGSGKMSPWCVPGRRSVARFRRGVFPGSQPWHFFRLMRSRRNLGQEKRRLVATFRRHVSEMSWFWQDMRVMYPKSPANSRLGIHCAKILPRRPPFPVRDPRIMHGAQILPCPDGATPVRPRSAARKQWVPPRPRASHVFSAAVPSGGQWALQRAVQLGGQWAPHRPGHQRAAAAPAPHTRASARPQHSPSTAARISSSLRWGFALFRRRRAPTIHTYRLRP